MPIKEYSLFIDDDRFPVDDTVIVVRSVDEAIKYIIDNGCPQHIMFDHDLGDNVPNGKDLAQWLIDRDMDYGHQFFPKGFSYSIHSQNPIGKENIDGLFKPYLKQFHED